ncbi:MAG TPA: AsmA family protein [Steroidobacteraceae bacterium]
MLKASLAVLAILLGLLVVLAAALAFVDGNRLRGPITRYVSGRYGREIRIDGELHTRLLSLHPGFVAEHVMIGNPPWVPPGTMASIDRLSVVLDLPLFGRTYALRELKMEGLDLHLRRDADGHANWLWRAPGILPGKGIPPIYSLSIPNAHLALDDDRRHLLFAGTLTTTGSQAAALHIGGKGHLNGRDATFTIEGEPLASVARTRPYSFTLNARSSNSHLTGHGSVATPFSFLDLDATFAADGEDLKDLYYLAGVMLPNTGPYKLSGKLARHNTSFRLSELVATFGESDLHANIASEMDSGGHTHVDVDLRSQRMRTVDLGVRAAGRAAGPPGTKPLLLPELEIRVDGIRRSSAAITFHAKEVDAGRLSFHTVAGKMSIDHGLVIVPQLSADLPDGKVSAHVRFDGRPAVPTATLDLNIADVRLGQLAKKDPTQPPLDGPLRGHLKLTGHGHSIHEIAADANGSMIATLPQGTMRASLAELTGIDLRGLRMLLTKNKDETPVRCAVARFDLRKGTLTAQTLVIDTDPVLITGAGSIELNTEALDLQLQGHPKHVRLLRVQAPVAIRGTLAHPSVGVEKEGRKFRLVDPGHGKDVDCATLLAETKTGAPSLP